MTESQGTLIAPSLLAADFGALREAVKEAEEAGADWMHLDVMDGHFVPNITFGAAVTEVVRKTTDLPLDVHLMIQDPDRYVGDFAAAGADVITVHAEVCPHLHRSVQRIKELGKKAGVALNPATPLDFVTGVMSDIDLLLIMTVNPGFGGQAFIPACTEKTALGKRLLEDAGRPEVFLEVDGGIDSESALSVVGAGANVLVAGSSVFRHPQGVRAGIEKLRHAASGAEKG